MLTLLHYSLMGEFPLWAERLSLYKKHHSGQGATKNISEFQFYSEGRANLDFAGALHINLWLMELKGVYLWEGRVCV